MIIIGHPYIEERQNGSYLLSDVIDKGRNHNYKLWYSVDITYGEYLCNDYADPFLLAVLQVAIVSGQDIKVEAPVSKRLLFNCRNTLIPLFSKMHKVNRLINVYSISGDDLYYHGKGVGVGCSLGVDSFSSLLKHLESDVISGYKATHLAIFNCGQLGDIDLNGAEENLRRTVHSLQPFSEKIGLPILVVDSNINEFFTDSKVVLLNRFIDSTISCVLALQKLLGKYVYSSSFSIEQFQVSNIDESHMEATFVPLLGTENTEIILSNPMLTRVEKTEYLSRFDITKEFLDVCWAAQYAYGECQDVSYLEGKTKKNCGKCDKCMRTLLTLEILGRIDDYKDIFDLNAYYSNKKKYLFRVIGKQDTNFFYKELVDLMTENSFTVPFLSYLLIHSAFLRKVGLLLYRIIGR